jgi:hypothetical protein
MTAATKHDKRRRADAQKRRTRERLLTKADRERRLQAWLKSDAAAQAAGLPINAHLTVLLDADYMVAATESLWRRLRRLTAAASLPFVAARAPEHAPGRKHHLHVVAHLREETYAAVAEVLADITGVGTAWFDARGRCLGRKHHGVVAVATDGRWMLQRHVDGAGGSSRHLIDYVAKGHGKQRAIGRHQRSQHLTQLTRSATVEHD